MSLGKLIIYATVACPLGTVFADRVTTDDGYGHYIVLSRDAEYGKIVRRLASDGFEPIYFSETDSNSDCKCTHYKMLFRNPNTRKIQMTKITFAERFGGARVDGIRPISPELSAKSIDPGMERYVFGLKQLSILEPTDSP